MAITGLPAKSSAPKPVCLVRERWPNERRSSRPNQRWLRRSVGRESRAAHAAASRSARATGVSCAICARVERRDERRNGPGRRDAGELGALVEHAGRAPRVAQVLERDELAAHRFGVRPVLVPARREERAAQRRGDAAGAGREARQAEVAHVHDRRTLADAAHDAAAIDARGAGRRDTRRAADRRGPPRI